MPTNILYPILVLQCYIQRFHKNLRIVAVAGWRRWSKETANESRQKTTDNNIL